VESGCLRNSPEGLVQRSPDHEFEQRNLGIQGDLGWEISCSLLLCTTREQGRLLRLRSGGDSRGKQGNLGTVMGQNTPVLLNTSPKIRQEELGPLQTPRTY
jgi:hypothetical protein